MARKDTSTVAQAEQAEAATPAPEASTEAPVTEGTQAEASAPSADGTAPTIEGTPPAEGEAAAPAEPDLTAFNAAAEAALKSDEFEAVNAEYNKLDRAGKAKATSHVNAEIKRQLTVVKDKDAAFAWGQLGQALKTVKAKASTEPKAPVNRTETVVSQLASLHLAYTTAKAHVVTEGLDEDWGNKLKAAIEKAQPEVEQLVAFRNQPEPTDEAKAAEGYVEPKEPEVSEVAKRAVRLAFQGGATKTRSASTSSGPTYSGPRRSISKHIEEAFASHPVGTFLSVAQIRAFESSEYGSDLPSAGAISAAMKSPKWDSAAHGVTPGNGGDKGTYGATKTGEPVRAAAPAAA